MKLNLLRTIGAGLSVAVILTSCDGLGKMLKKQKDFKYTVTPNPIEMHGDSVQFSVSGKFSPKLLLSFIISKDTKQPLGELSVLFY